MGDPTKFWDKIAEKYAAKPISDEASYQKKLEITQTYLNPDMNVLEFGCGTGSTALIHAPHVKHIRATDFSSAMLDIARKKAANHNITNVTFERAAIEDLNVTDESLDVVLGLSVLHLLQDKEDIIARVYKMLKPGGRFVTSTVCIGDSMRFFKIIAPIGMALGVFPLIKVFTGQELEDSIAASGFDIEKSWRPQKSKAVFIVARKPE